MMSWINFADFQDYTCATVLSSSTILKFYNHPLNHVLALVFGWFCQ